MSKLGNWLVEQLTGGRAEPDPGGDFMARVRELVRATGSQRKAARTAGVDPRTVERWFQRERQGRPVRPMRGTPAKVGTGLRRAQLSSGRPTDATLVMEATQRRADRGRTNPRVRRLDARNLKLRPGTMARVADVWVRTGDREAVADAFLAGVGDETYRAMLTPLPADRDPDREPDPGPAPGPGRAAAQTGDDDDDDLDDIDDLDAWDDYVDDMDGSEAAAEAAAAEWEADYGLDP